VLFADLVGFTTYAEDRDPETVRDLLTRYFDTATGIVVRHGGTVEKFIGDAVMAVWGTPVTHEDDAERSVRAAIELVDAVRALAPGLDARCGVLGGEAAVTLGAANQGMVAGDLVNTAARLQGVAEPGTVLVGEATMRAAADAIVFEPLGDHSLKGKSTPVPAWRALRVVSGRGGQGRADALEAPFVGRAEELRLLKDQLHAVGRERRVRLVSISGPGGMGKSRLVWELEKYVDGVTEEIYWHRGRSPSYGEGITFWALGEMVRRRSHLSEDDDEATTRERIAATLAQHVDDPEDGERIGPALLSLLGVEPAPPGGREALFPAWRLFFERIAEAGTTVLVFEDLQWADSGLLDFVDHLLDWSRGLPILVLTLARPELLDRRPDWGAGRRHFTSIALDPLSDDDVRALLNGLVPGLPADAIAMIVRRAEGIPLYAVETVRSLLADGRIERVDDVYRPVGDLSNLSVPESLRSLIASRLDTLDGPGRSLLQDAAVLGQVFAPDALTGMSGLPPQDVEARLRDLVRRELLDVESDPRSPERGQYKFVQSLIREVAYGTLARRDRRARHLAAARHYEAVGDEEMGAILASHYLAAHAVSDDGPAAEAIAVQARLALVAAADRAGSLGAPDQAVVYLEQAVSVTSDLTERAHLLDRTARAAAMAARRDAEAYAAAAVEAYRELGDPVGMARASVALGQTLLDASELERAAQVLEEVLPDVQALGDEPLLAETLASLARGYMRLTLSDKAVEVADRGLAIGERLQLDEVITEALINKGSALGMLGRRREGVALLAGAVELARGGPVNRELRARNNLSSQLGDDDPARAIAILEEAAEIARRVGDRAHFNWLVGSLAAHRYGTGDDWESTIAVLDEALEGATILYDRVRLSSLRILFAIARGDNDVEQRIAEIRAMAGERRDAEARFPLELSESYAALVGGRLEDAYRHAVLASELETQKLEVGVELAARAAAWQKDLAALRATEQRWLAIPYRTARLEALVKTTTAVIAGLDGRRDDSLQAFRGARDGFTRLGQHFDRAQVDLDALVVLPEEPEVRSWAEGASTVFERVGATPYLEQLRAILASPQGAADVGAPSPAGRESVSAG